MSSSSGGRHRCRYSQVGAGRRVNRLTFVEAQSRNRNRSIKSGTITRTTIYYVHNYALYVILKQVCLVSERVRAGRSSWRSPRPACHLQRRARSQQGRRCHKGRRGTEWRLARPPQLLQRGIPQSAKWWRLVKPDRMMDCTCSEERFKLSNVMVGRRKFSKPPIDSNKTSGGISAGR